MCTERKSKNMLKVSDAVAMFIMSVSICVNKHRTHVVFEIWWVVIHQYTAHPLIGTRDFYEVRNIMIQIIIGDYVILTSLCLVSDIFQMPKSNYWLSSMSIEWVVKKFVKKYERLNKTQSCKSSDFRLIRHFSLGLFPKSNRVKWVVW